MNLLGIVIFLIFLVSDGPLKVVQHHSSHRAKVQAQTIVLETDLADVSSEHTRLWFRAFLVLPKGLPSWLPRVARSSYSLSTSQ
jgi:hypothetical protein